MTDANDPRVEAACNAIGWEIDHLAMARALSAADAARSVVSDEEVIKALTGVADGWVGKTLLANLRAAGFDVVRR